MACDDVIAIRVDTARAVAEFREQLHRQAEEGESAAPAKPANRAVFRELAPYRLVEYGYVDNGVGAVEGAYVGFPDGGVYSCDEVLTEEAVDALVADESRPLPALYVYVLLARPAGADAACHYLDALADHLGQPLVGVFAGAADVHGAAGMDLRGAAAIAAGETDRHLGKAKILARHRARTALPDGRAFAHFSHRFSNRILEFASASERDAFVAWSERYCASAQAEGDAVVLRPAEPCAAPPPTFRVIRLPAPAPANADANADDAHAYWAEVAATIDHVIEQEQDQARQRTELSATDKHR